MRSPLHLLVLSSFALWCLLACPRQILGDTVVLDGSHPPMPADLRSGNVLVLKRETVHDWSRTPCVIRQNGVTIRADNGLGEPPTIKYRGPQWSAAIQDEAEGTSILGIRFDVGSKNFGITGTHARKSRYESCTLTSSSCYGLLKLTGVQDVLVHWCGNDLPSHGGLIYLGGRTDRDINRNVDIDGCWSAGSIHEHVLRVHNTEKLTITKCRFLNPSDADWAVKRGAALNLRDGTDFTILESQFSGQVLLGPLADSDGGKDDPPGPERERKLALRLINVRMQDCEIAAGYVILEAGLENLLIDGLSGRFQGAGGFGITAMPAYGPRPPAAGRIRNVSAVAARGLTSGAMERLAVDDLPTSNPNR